jgi:lysine 6-dehydrogenase
LTARVTVRDLIDSPDVEHILVADLDLDVATSVIESLDDDRLEAAAIDVSDTEATSGLLEGFDITINSTPYYFNLDVMRAALQARSHYIDLGGLFHTTRKQMTLDEDFREASLLAVLGCGSAPGITNIMARYGCDNLDRVHAIDVQLGGVDLSGTESPFRPPYSLETLLDEWVMAPYVFEQGQWVELPPFSGGQEVSFPQPVGTAQAHYTIHSEIATLPLSFQPKGIERCTLRAAFPTDFVRTLKMLVDLRLADEEPVEVKGVKLRPRDLLVAVLGPRRPGDDGMRDDCDCLRVEVQGRRAGQQISHTLETMVRPHPEWRFGASALDAGVPPSIVAQMIGRGEITSRGVVSPEQCVDPLAFFRQLGRRGIHIHSIVREDLS